MDEEPDGIGLGANAPAQVSQWLFTTPRRGRLRRLGVFALVIVLLATVVVGLLTLSSVFFPQ